MSNTPTASSNAIQFSKYVNKSDLKGLPKIDVIKLITLIAEVSDGKKTPQEAAKEFGKPYAAFAKVFVTKKTKEIAKDLINKGVTKADMQELAETDFADKLIISTTSVAKLVQQYMSHKITDEVFIEKLGQEGIQDLAKQVLKASGIDAQMADKLGSKSLSEIGNVATCTLTFAALTEAYKIVREAQEDLQLAREECIKIEAACNESIALIRQYRAEMEYAVNHYLTERLETFESGFAAMDKAILENDSDGYIRGNVAIQEILGYKSQFTNQEEFDDLMDSDIAFKL